MSNNIFLIFNKNNTDYALTVLISGILFWVVNFYGLGYTFDSNLYVEIAQQINSSSFLQVEGFNIKPPIFPVIIFLVGESNVVWINFFCYLSIQVVGVYWSRRIYDKKLRYLFLVALIFATPHILVSSFLWTEPLFLTQMLFSFYLIDRYKQTKQAKFFVPAVVLLILLPFIRFAGIFLVIPIFGFLFIRAENSKAVLISVLTLLIITFAWVALFNEGFMERWGRYIRPFLSGQLSRLEFNSASYIKALSGWFFPYVLDGNLTRLITCSVFLSLIYKSTRAYFRTKGGILLIAPLVFLLYFVLMMSVFKVEYYSAERYISIFYLLIILNIFLHVDEALKATKSGYVGWFAYLTLCVFVFYSVLRTIKNVYFWQQLRSDYLSNGIIDGFLSVVC